MVAKQQPLGLFAPSHDVSLSANSLCPLFTFVQIRPFAFHGSRSSVSRTHPAPPPYPYTMFPGSQSATHPIPNHAGSPPNFWTLLEQSRLPSGMSALPPYVHVPVEPCASFSCVIPYIP